MIHLPLFEFGSSIPWHFVQNYMAGEENIPEPYLQRMEDLKLKNPDWEHFLFDSEAVEKFILEYYGDEVIEIYRKIDPNYYAARSDFFRYLFIYARGGVYLDIKATALKPMKEVIRSDDRFILSNWPIEPGLVGSGWSAGKRRELADMPRGEYMQWFIISAQGHPFMREVLGHVIRNILNYNPLFCGVGHSGVLRTTGPIAYSRAIFPKVGKYPNRIVEAQLDLGLIYENPGDWKYSAVKEIRSKGHYGKLSIPIVVPFTRIDVIFGLARQYLEVVKKRLGALRHRYRFFCCGSDFG